MPGMGNYSGIVLAGGKSSRMGTDKALLPFGKSTLLEHQISLLQRSGIEDVMISGRYAVEGARTVPDILPERGPLGGIFSCLKNAGHEYCVVLCADMPLVTDTLLSALIRSFHPETDDILAVSHQGIVEPLLGIYKSGIWPAIEALVRIKPARVTDVFAKVNTRFLPYEDDPGIFENCNRRNEYDTACRYYEMKGQEK